MCIMYANDDNIAYMGENIFQLTIWIAKIDHQMDMIRYASIMFGRI
jgi:hypothetical protein